jgi:hypothetical protein
MVGQWRQGKSAREAHGTFPSPGWLVLLTPHAEYRWTRAKIAAFLDGLASAAFRSMWQAAFRLS